MAKNELVVSKDSSNHENKTAKPKTLIKDLIDQVNESKEVNHNKEINENKAQENEEDSSSEESELDLKAMFEEKKANPRINFRPKGALSPRSYYKFKVSLDIK